MNPRSLPQGPRAAFPGALWFRFKTDRLGFLDHAATFGDLAGWRIGGQRYYLLNHPDLVRDLLSTNHALVHKGRVLERARALLGTGLLTSEAPVHEARKRLVMPAFHRARLAAYGRCMTDYAGEEAAGWRDGETRDLHAAVTTLTLRVVARTLFDRDVRDEAEEFGRHFTRLMETFLLYMVPFADQILRLPIPAMRRLQASLAWLDRTIREMIAARRHSGEDRGDLLSMLIATRDAEGGGALTDDEIRDECMTLLMAGHETTANALTWTLALLAAHPEAQERVAAACRNALGGRPATMEDLPGLAPAEHVLAESMRLYPPVWNVARRAVQDYPLGGRLAQAGSILFASQWVMHRSARFFPDPLRFDPERWVATPRTALDPFVYFPFSRGPRGCVGEGFAWMEGILILATLLRDWRFEPGPGPFPRPQPLVTLRPRGGLPLTLRRR